MEVMKHTSKKSILAYRPRTDVTTSPKHGHQQFHKRSDVLQRVSTNLIGPVKHSSKLIDLIIINISAFSYTKDS